MAHRSAAVRYGLGARLPSSRRAAGGGSQPAPLALAGGAAALHAGRCWFIGESDCGHDRPAGRAGSDRTGPAGGEAGTVAEGIASDATKQGPAAHATGTGLSRTWGSEEHT